MKLILSCSVLPSSPVKVMFNSVSGCLLAHLSVNYATYDEFSREIKALIADLVVY